MSQQPPPPPSQPPPPEWQPPAKTTKPWWRRWWVIGIGVIVLFTAIGSLMEPPEDEPNAAGIAASTPSNSPTPEDTEATTVESSPTPTAEPAPDPTTEEPTQEPPDPTFAFGPEELEDRWARAVNEFGSPNLQLKDFAVDDNGVRTVFQANVAPTVEMLGSIVDGRVAEIMTLSQGSSDHSRNADVLLSWGLLIAAAHPDLTPDQRGEVLDQLGVNDSSDFTSDGHEATVVRDRVEFSLQFSEVIGWSMVATPAE